jgi:Tol biopolymer transport system component
MRRIVPLLGLFALALSVPAGAQTRACTYEHWTIHRWFDNAADVEFTPDGGHIVFWRVIEGFGGGNNSATHIFIADLDANGDPVNERDLTPDMPGENDVPAISADGTKIAFTSTFGAPAPFAGGAGGPGADIWVMNIDGSDRVRLTMSFNGTSFRPRWSHTPGTFKLFYTHAPSAFDSYRWELFVADVTGDHLENATMINPDPLDDAFYESADFAADDSGVYYTGTTANSENFDIYRYDFATAAVTRITDHPELDESSHLSPDGTKLAFISSRDHPSLWSSYLYASWVLGLPPVADNFGVAAYAVAAWNEPVQPQGTDIYLMNPDGSGVTRLTNFPGQVGGAVPNWSPDGCTLAMGAFQYRTYNEHPWIASTPYPGGTNAQYKVVFS